MRTIRIVNSRFSPLNPGAIASIRYGVVKTPSKTRMEVLSAHCHTHRRVDGNEGSGENPFAEQILQRVGNTECRLKCIRRVGISKIMREHAIPHESGDAAQEDSGGDEKR